MNLAVGSKGVWLLVAHCRRAELSSSVGLLVLNYEFSLRSSLEKRHLLVCSTWLIVSAIPSALTHEVNLGDKKENQHLLGSGTCCYFPVRLSRKVFLLSEEKVVTLGKWSFLESQAPSVGFLKLVFQTCFGTMDYASAVGVLWWWNKISEPQKLNLGLFLHPPCWCELHIPSVDDSAAGLFSCQGIMYQGAVNTLQAN